jgi:hypothetical protein
MKGYKSVKGATLIDNTIGLVVASGLTAISLAQVPGVLDSADKAALHYIQQTERSAHSVYEQYSMAKGSESLTLEIEFNGVLREGNHVTSPLGHYCYDSSQLEVGLTRCVAAE